MYDLIGNIKTSIKLCFLFFLYSNRRRSIDIGSTEFKKWAESSGLGAHVGAVGGQRSAHPVAAPRPIATQTYFILFQGNIQ